MSISPWQMVSDISPEASDVAPTEATFMLHIRRDLSGSRLLTIVCKRLLLRELEERFKSQSKASRSGIALGVSPFGVSPQVVDHRLEGATIPRPIAMAQGANQCRQVVG